MPPTSTTSTTAASDHTQRPGWSALMNRMHEIKDLDGIVGLVEWEDETYAPPGARLARGPQLATLEAIRHRKLLDPELRDLLATVTPLTPEERALVDRLRRQVDRATRVPEDLVKALAEAKSAAVTAWQNARAEAKFERFAPHLERLLPLIRERAAALRVADQSAYDALLDEYEPEMTTAQLRPVLEALREGLIPLVERLSAAPPPTDDFLRQRFDDQQQWQFTLRLLNDLGFDFEHGRQDRSTHPFTATVNERDVRVTTRIDESNIMSAISSTVHECGHALYEQGFDPDHFRTYLASAASMGLHESQSRLWENQVGLGQPFWQYYLPALKEAFPTQLGDVHLDAFWRAINRVRPSLIRVDADEVTYNLHILLRFELELALIDGGLTVRDLPAAWSDTLQRLLGLRPANDAEGCLQDIHWSMAAFGYFPTYTLGNLYAAQLFEAFARSHPEASSDFAAGRFQPLLDWLRKHVHRRGHTAAAQTIVHEAVGAPLSVEPLLNYLRAKYAQLYGLDLTP